MFKTKNESYNIPLSNVSINVIAKDAKIGKCQATNNPFEFVEKLIKKHNQNENTKAEYNQIQIQDQNNEKDQISLYCSKSVIGSSVTRFVNKISNKNEQAYENIQYSFIFFIHLHSTEIDKEEKTEINNTIGEESHEINDKEIENKIINENKIEKEIEIENVDNLGEQERIEDNIKIEIEKEDEGKTKEKDHEKPQDKELEETEKTTKKRQEFTTFVLTTNQGWKVLKGYRDSFFSHIIASRIVCSTFHRQDVSLLIGRKDSEIIQYKSSLKSGLGYDNTLLRRYNSFVSHFNLNSSIYKHLPKRYCGNKKGERKINVRIGEGSIKLKISLKLREYLDILQYFGKIFKGEKTFDLNGKEEKDDPTYNSFLDLKKVNKREKIRKLDNSLIRTIYESIMNNIQYCTLYISHYFFNDFYQSYKFKLLIHKNDRTIYNTYNSAPTIHDIFQILGKHLRGLEYKDFKDNFSKCKMKYSRRKKYQPLINFFQGDLIDKGKLYIKNRGMWLKLSSDYLIRTERNFLNLIDKVLITEDNKKGHLLDEMWVAKESWTAFSANDSGNFLKDEFKEHIKYFQKEKFSYLDEDMFITNENLTIDIERDIKNINKINNTNFTDYWENLKLFLKKNYKKQVSVEQFIKDSKLTDEVIIKQIFDILQSKKPLIRSFNTELRKIPILNEDDTVKFWKLNNIQWTKNISQYLKDSQIIEKIINKLKDCYQKKEKFTKGMLKEMGITQERSQNKIFKDFRKTHSTKEKTNIWVFQGEIKSYCSTDNQQLVNFFAEKSKNYLKIMKDEQDYNRLYLDRKDYLVGDQIFPNKRNKVELFDLLYYGNKGETYLYHVKKEFGNNTGIACIQIKESAQCIANTKNNNYEMLKDYYQKIRDTKAHSFFREKLKKILNRDFPTVEDFIKLFQNKKIIYVYAFIDTATENRLLERELNPIHALGIDELEKCFTNSKGFKQNEEKKNEIIDFRNMLQKDGYLDKHFRLNSKFIKCEKKNFKKYLIGKKIEENISEEIYVLLSSKFSKFNSFYAKKSLEDVAKEVTNLGFEFRIQQISRPGKNSEYFQRINIKKDYDDYDDDDDDDDKDDDDNDDDDHIRILKKKKLNTCN
ncbi:hypothetical protein M0812_08947 [Anaeramoeba flamelloides]|uniref:Uncharacterized protein n=1 Tax=Anaeramoeba flamelloides TaxID=1746091 RepID=A0AAV7ZM69_9EUKA|nr:hypothetical protein M0812_08947 [Anaeramoeba flamelloides]